MNTVYFRDIAYLKRRVKSCNSNILFSFDGRKQGQKAQNSALIMLQKQFSFLVITCSLKILEKFLKSNIH